MILAENIVSITIAVYAAVVATGVLLWDIIKWWRSGPRVQFKVRSNWEVVAMNPKPEKGWKIYFEAVNNGDRPTTIKDFGVEIYKNRFSYIVGAATFEQLLGDIRTTTP